MSTAPEYAGYVRWSPDALQEWRGKSGGPPEDAEEVWELTTDKSRLLHAEVKDTLLLPEEAQLDFLTTWIQDRWPSEHTDYGRVQLSAESYHRRSPVSNLPARFSVLPYEFYLQKSKPDMERVVLLARELAPRPLLFSPYAAYSQLPWHKSVRNAVTGRYVDYSAIEEHGCYVRTLERELAGKSRWVTEIVYSPKITERRAARRDKVSCPPAKRVQEFETKKRVLAIHEIAKVARNLYEALPDWARRGLPREYPTTRAEAVEYLCAAISFYDGCHQRPGAHRRAAAFQQLIRLWRNEYICANTKSVWPKRMQQWHATRFQKFCEFMDLEASRRLPKARPSPLATTKAPW